MTTTQHIDDHDDHGGPTHFELPELTLETKSQESEPYLGIIVSSELSRSVYNGEKQNQWILMVRPVRHASGVPIRPSKTGLLYGFIKIPEGVPGERTVLMRTFTAFGQIFGMRDEDGVVRGLVDAQGNSTAERFVGLVAWFQQKSYSYGKGISDSKPAPTPVAKATLEEWAECQALPAIEIPTFETHDDTSSALSAPAPIKHGFDLGDETLVQLALSLYDGRTRAQVAKKAMTDATLDDQVRKDLISGALLNALIEAGLAKISEDNTVKVAAPVAEGV